MQDVVGPAIRKAFFESQGSMYSAITTALQPKVEELAVGASIGQIKPGLDRLEDILNRLENLGKADGKPEIAPAPRLKGGK